MSASDRVTVEQLPQSRVRCTVRFSAEEIKPAEEKALRAFEPQLKLAGFRPGNAPLEMIKEKVPADGLYEEIVRHLLQKELPSLLQNNDIQPIMHPKVEVESRDPLVVAITFVCRPEVTIKNIDSLAPKKEITKVEQKEIDQVIESVLADHKIKKPADRAAKKGDDVRASFTATNEAGEDIPGLKAEGYDISIGSNTLLPGFEDEMIGLKAGDKKTFTLTLPEKFPEPTLQGKKATFNATVDEVHDVELPELTDAFAKEKLQADSVDAFKKAVEESIIAREEQFKAMERERALMDAITKNTKVDIADELLDDEVKGMVQDWAQRLQQQGMSIEDALAKQNKKPEDIEKEMREEAQKRWKLRLGLGKIIEEKKVTITEEEMKAGVQRFIESLPEDQREQAQKMLPTNSNLQEEVRWRTLVEKAVAQLLEA